MKTTNRPKITEELVNQICKTISENPTMGRSKLSVELCEMWDWRDASGKVKDMSCRDLLSSLEKAGQIVLPPRMRSPRKPGDSKGIKHFAHDETPFIRTLRELQPLNVSVVTSKESMTQFQSYIDGHGLCLLETFVECDRFKGTCYKAANWINVGQTTGRGRDGGYHGAILPIKDIYIYPLETRFRQALSDTKGR